MPVLEPLTVANQFPDYPLATLPNTRGMRDTSWHYDACPSFRTNDLLVWVDWPNPHDREDPNGDRYVVVCLDKDGQLIDCSVVLTTNDWSLVRTIMGLED